MFANRYRYLFIALLGGYSFVNVLYMEALEYYGLHPARGYVLVLLLIAAFLIWEGNRLVEHLLPRLQRWLGASVHPLLITFGLSLLITLVAVMVPTFLLNHFVLGLPAKEFALGLKLIVAVGFRINLFLNTINVIFYFMRQLRESQVEAEQFKKISLQAQFQSLKDQVNPHFLFNNLNVLSSLVFKDAEQSAEFIQQLSKVYRYVLQNQEKELVDLGSELEFMESYMYLLRTRFGDNLNIHIDVPPALLSQYTVPVALQMLVENAIKHNVSSRTKPLRIEVFADNGTLVVKNNLQPKQLSSEYASETSTGIGLQNITKRYAFVSHRRVEVAKDDASFTVKIPLIQLAS